MNPLETAWTLLKEEGPHIVWVTPEKRMGWVDAHGPYTSESIYAALKEQGTWDNRTESISDEKKINCEDNSHEEGWSYCGKPECESCGGGE